MYSTDGWMILFYSIGATFVSEALSWLWVYRTQNYKTLKSSIDKTSKKLEVMKSQTTAISRQSAKKKKMDRMDTSIKLANSSLLATKMQIMVVAAITMVINYTILSTYYEGKSVAKLPFVPIKFFQRLSHRGLPGNDLTDCSMMFLYALCNLAIRPSVQKLLGFSPPRTPGTNFMGVPVNEQGKPIL